MTEDLLQVPGAALRSVWVFSVNLPEERIDAFKTPVTADDGSVLEWPLAEALGAGLLDQNQIEVFRAEDMRDYGLDRYLIDAAGMDEDLVAPDAARLRALSGPLVLVFARALRDGTTRIDPKPPLRLVGRYAESVDLTRRAPPRTEADAGVLESPPQRPSNAVMSGRIASVALLVLFALVALMIWIAA